MVEAGINDGDFAVIDSGDEVRNGEIGAVVVGDEATLKRVHFRRNKMILEPANAAYEPLEIDQQAAHRWRANCRSAALRVPPGRLTLHLWADRPEIHTRARSGWVVARTLPAMHQPLRAPA